MIVGFFLQMFYVLLSWIISVLPTIAFVNGIVVAWSTAWGFMNAVNFLYPVDTLLQVLTLEIAFAVFVFFYNHSHVTARYVRGR